jgi:hypothetical protein
MVLTSKTRLGKRKLEINEVRKEKQTTTSKKHDKKCFAAVENPAKNKISAPKPQTKSDMVAKMETMQELNDALLEEVKNNEEAIAILEGKEKKYQEAIKSLEERVKNLKSETPLKSQVDLETQTSSNPGDTEPQIPCRLCIYVATCEEQLNWHMDDEHDLNTDMYFETDFPCEICGKWCRTGADLTYHLKKHEVVKSVHPIEGKTCSYFLDGCCVFDSNECWFDHPDTVPRTLKSLKCRFCEKTLQNKSELMVHRKLEHPQKISACKKEMDGSCVFGSEKCWYKHGKIIENMDVEPTDMISRLFGMMEKFTKRMEEMERQLYNESI